MNRRKLKKVDTIKDIVKYYLYLKDQCFEQLMGIGTDAEGNVVYNKCISTQNNVSTAEFYPSEFWDEFMEYEPSKLYLLHNHPSGCSKPSDEDIETTKIMGVCSELFDVVLEDHIILGSKGFCSMKKHGYEW